MDAQRLREIDDELDLNADYAESNSEAKAGKFASALKRKMVLVAESASRGSQSETMRFDMETMEKLLEKAEKFLMNRRGRANAGFRRRGFIREPERSSP